MEFTFKTESILLIGGLLDGKIITITKGIDKLITPAFIDNLNGMRKITYKRACAGSCLFYEEECDRLSLY